MGGVNIKLVGFDQTRKKLQEAAKKLPKEVDAEIADSIQRMRGRAIADAPADQGLLRSGIQGERISELNHGLFSNAKHSAYMEFGTKSQFQPIPGFEDAANEARGAGGGTWEEMIARLTEWVRRKGISGTYSVKSRRRRGSKASQANEDRQTAIMIARSILKHGVKPQPFFFKQLTAEQPVLLKNIENLLKQL